MASLWNRDRHEQLVDEPWNDARVRAAVEEIARDSLDALRSGCPERHPLDADAPERAHSLYYGTAGVLWGLRHLVRRDAIGDEPSLGEQARSLPERYGALPDGGAEIPSYFVGAAGVLLVALREGGGAAVADALHEVAASHADHPSREAYLGSAGTLVAATFAHELTGEERFASLARAHARALLETWERHPSDRFDLWTQDLYGAKRRLLGASHGFAGNVQALLRASTLLAEPERAAVLTRAVRSLRATAIERDGLATWPISAGGVQTLVQWCHGAPGIVTSFARAPREPELDDLLRRAGELVWRAGPLRKGPSLCHGTAGNGETFLVLFARTGDELWLERARRFAMHALGQVGAQRARFGRGRHTLFTGDVGVALYLWQCRTGESGMPALDW